MTYRCLSFALLLVSALSSPFGAHAQQLREVDKAEISRTFVLANAEFTILHEIGHAVFRDFDMPVLGLEEDAADQFATIVMIARHDMQLDPINIHRLLMVATEWLAEWDDAEADPINRHAYWDVHSLAIQRFYNITCLVYGANPDALADLLDTDALPAERGFVCEEMYRRARHAVLWLMDAYGRREIGPGTRYYGMTVRYEEALTPEADRMRALVASSPMAQDVAARTSELLAWPEDLTLVFMSCGGPDAYYNERAREVTVCYELLSEFERIVEDHLGEIVEGICTNPATRRLFGARHGCPPESTLRID